MTYPTEMTVATGTTVYAGDPASDEKILSREVRVSVTYRIEDPETDLTALARAKAAEVEQARMAVQERIGRHHAVLDAIPFEPNSPFDPSDPALVPPAAEPDDAEEDGDEESDEESEEERDDEENCPGARYERPQSWTPPPSQPGTGMAAPETDWATKPQVLALGSHLRRLGVSPADQAALLRARFGKLRLERLTKEEASGLMRSLERGELGPDPTESNPGEVGWTPSHGGAYLTEA